MQQTISRLLLPMLLLASCSGNLKSSKANDTTFLLKVVTKDDNQKVYIERNRNSAEYKTLLNFTFDKYELASFKESNENLKLKYPKPLKIYDLAGLPKEWLPVYSYKGKYYLYYPSDSGNDDRRIITDSTIIYWGMEGPAAAPYQSVKQTNSNIWLLITDELYQRAKADTVIIHIIDPKTKMAVWEESVNPKQSRYGLYVPKENAKMLDMVVTKDDMNKVAEFNFDKVDYKSLIKKN